MSRKHEAGYVLFGIAIGLVILGISMTAAVPLWQKIVQREREKELIFRGYQYMQAIELYQRKFPGAYPPNVEALIEGKFLRQEYEDPFAESEDGGFRIIRQLSPELQQGIQQQQQDAARAAGITDLNRSQARMRQPGQPGVGGPGQAPSRPFQSTMGRGPSDQSMGGIVGVASVGDEETFYKVPGKEKYRDWLFVYGVQGQPGQSGQSGQSVQAGQAGQPVQMPAQMPAQMMPPGQPGHGQQSPFPGLPPPPGLTSFRFGFGPISPGAPGGQPGQPGQPGQILPGQPGSGVQPGQAGQPGQGQFGPGQPATPGQMPQQRQPRRQP